MARPTDSDPILSEPPSAAESPDNQTAFGTHRAGFQEGAGGSSGWADALDDFDVGGAAPGPDTAVQSTRTPAVVETPVVASTGAAGSLDFEPELEPDRDPPAVIGEPDRAPATERVKSPAPRSRRRRPSKPRRGGLLGFIARLFAR